MIQKGAILDYNEYLYKREYDYSLHYSQLLTKLSNTQLSMPPWLFQSAHSRKYTCFHYLLLPFTFFWIFHHHTICLYWLPLDPFKPPANSFSSTTTCSWAPHISRPSQQLGIMPPNMAIRFFSTPLSGWYSPLFRRREPIIMAAIAMAMAAAAARSIQNASEPGCIREELLECPSVPHPSVSQPPLPLPLPPPPPPLPILVNKDKVRTKQLRCAERPKHEQKLNFDSQNKLCSPPPPPPPPLPLPPPLPPLLLLLLLLLLWLLWCWQWGGWWLLLGGGQGGWTKIVMLLL